MILITGFMGFIGSCLYKALPNATGIDIREGMNLLTCELPQNINLIYHLAAQSSVESSWCDPLHDLDNIRITARLVHAYPNAKIIYANSCAAMDKSSPYGFSKWASGEYLKQFHANCVNCIFPNIYGEGSRSVVDIFKGKDEITIFGDGTHTRDYVHINDIIDGLLKAKDWPKGDYYMGSGKSTSVLELASKLAGKLASNLKIRFVPKRKEAAEVTVPNTTPNWEAKISVFDYL